MLPASSKLRTVQPTCPSWSNHKLSFKVGRFGQYYWSFFRKLLAAASLHSNCKMHFPTSSAGRKKLMAYLSWLWRHLQLLSPYSVFETRKTHAGRPQSKRRGGGNWNQHSYKTARRTSRPCQHANKPKSPLSPVFLSPYHLCDAHKEEGGTSLDCCPFDDAYMA